MATLRTDVLPGRRAGRRPIVALGVAGGISLAGNQLTGLALPWLVLTQLGTATDAGIVGAAIVLPAVFGAIAGGAVIDRFGPRATSIAADLASGVAVAAIPVAAATIGLSMPLLIVLAFAGALLDAPGGTARTVLIPALAGGARVAIERANGIFQAIESTSLVVGPIVAGLAVAALGPANALILDAASFAVSAALVAAFVPTDAGLATDAPPAERADLTAGLRALARDPVLRGLTIVAAVANLVGTPLFLVVLPALAAGDRLGAATLGWLLAAYGIGLIGGSLAYASRGSRWPRRTVWILGLAGTGLALAAASAPLPVGATIAALVAAGVASGPLNPIAFTVMQERVPVAARGRVFGAVLGAVLLAAPLGMLVIGFATERLGPEVALVGMGVTFLGLAGTMAAAPVFRGLDRLPSGALENA